MKEKDFIDIIIVMIVIIEMPMQIIGIINNIPAFIPWWVLLCLSSGKFGLAAR